MSKRTASEVEEDTVANVAEVVWGLLTGTRGSVNPSAMSAFAGISELDKIRMYKKLRATDKAAAYQFAVYNGIVSAKVEIEVHHDRRERVYEYEVLMTQKLLDLAWDDNMHDEVRQVLMPLANKRAFIDDSLFIRLFDGDVHADFLSDLHFEYVSDPITGKYSHTVKHRTLSPAW